MNTTHTAQAIEATGVSKTFHPRSSLPVHALKNANLTVQPGEIIALLGTNGAGKTTLLDLILGLTTPTSGTVTVMGHSPTQAVYKQHIGALMQTGGLLNELTVKDTVEMVAATFPEHLPLDEVIAQADLEPIYARRVGKCSGGEQQRLRFALAILGNPEIHILDEPTAGMDAGARRRFWDSMTHQAQQGRTIIFATHYLEEAEHFAQRIVLMKNGEIIADGTTAELRNMTAGRVVSAEFPGELPDLTRLPGVTGNDVTGNRLSMTTEDSDALARYLLTHTEAHDLSISSHTLEDTFLALTKEHQET
ncbi:ABC transporter ATP-binding protein [Corynebacterium urealyticum]|uniref:Putative ABC transport system, ATP-binding protein n=1 Tax=Corynebacterium urealyticum (strain ATCC 43042 / DSM 7109) TaxID=504474 RepID=B1VGZ9_CORU7|nr:ABC transporter ATP-binding protein [Corynebacterium urealyticum]QQC41526.1 ABC transporter ATP-binding protein [Corynebacterium urealyticum]CAQ05040.1 putative ABC transport system, ATP-binding protein [Corynebacterium urealyticum DSM 7109]SNV84892.1 ABC transporter ATP-binding protein [Corynebacterium urealyticum]